MDQPPDGPTYKKQRHFAYDERIRQRLRELDVDPDTLQHDFWYLPWYEQRRYLEEVYGLFYCVRCALPIPFDQAAPDRNGLCLAHIPPRKHEYPDAFSGPNPRRYRRYRSKHALANATRRNFMESRGAGWAFNKPAPPRPRNEPSNEAYQSALRARQAYQAHQAALNPVDPNSEPPEAPKQPNEEQQVTGEEFVTDLIKLARPKPTGQS